MESHEISSSRKSAQNRPAQILHDNPEILGNAAAAAAIRKATALA
jgi:hypothetical protein